MKGHYYLLVAEVTREAGGATHYHGPPPTVTEREEFIVHAVVAQYAIDKLNVALREQHVERGGNVRCWHVVELREVKTQTIIGE